MDKITITPTPLCGRVKIPPSKSYAHRAIIAAFLSGGKCALNNIAMSDDIRATLNCIKALGGSFSQSADKTTLIVEKNGNPLNPPLLECNESGSTLRFFIPIALCFAENIEFLGKGRLMERPLIPYFEIFDKVGIKYNQNGSHLSVNGKLRAGDFSIDASLSSQFVTGLLFALPLLDGDSRILIQGELSSKGYIDITLDVLRTFGIEIENQDYKLFIIKGNQKYKPTDYTVEGDFSQAAFFLTAGALGGSIICEGLNPKSLQGDKKIFDIIEKIGARLEETEAGCYRAVQTEEMHAVTIDADEIPDLVPILAVLLSFCKGESRTVNASRLRIKESDRLAAITTELKVLGAAIEEGTDFLVINGIQSLKGAQVSSHNDHRIVMAAAIAACRSHGDVTITKALDAVKKSYPDFFEDYAKLGGVFV